MPKEEKEVKTEITENKSIKYQVEEVKQTAGYVVRDISSGTDYSMIEALAKIMNDIDEIKRRIL